MKASDLFVKCLEAEGVTKFLESWEENALNDFTKKK